MIGKFVLIACLCFSLAQVQGTELEEAIKNGLKKVDGMYEGGQKKINGSIESVGYKSKVVESKTVQFLIKSAVVQQGTKQALREVAKAMEEKAKAQNKSEAVFECIRKTEKNANDQIQNVTDKFKVNVRNLEKDALAKIRTESKPLYGMQEALKVQYQKVVKTIQACKTTSCVDNAVRDCAKWLDQMNAEIGKIFDQIGNIVNSHGKDANKCSGNHLTQLIQIKSDGIRDIKNCVSG